MSRLKHTTIDLCFLSLFKGNVSLPMLRITIHFIRIRISHFAYADGNPDPTNTVVSIHQSSIDAADKGTDNLGSQGHKGVNWRFRHVLVPVQSVWRTWNPVDLIHFAGSGSELFFFYE